MLFLANTQIQKGSLKKPFKVARPVLQECLLQSKDTAVWADVIQCSNAAHWDRVNRKYLCSLCGANVPKPSAGLFTVQFLGACPRTHKTH